MSNVVSILEARRVRELKSPMGRLLQDFATSERRRLKMMQERNIPHEAICMCYFRDAYGDEMCNGCPANEDGSA